MPDDLGSGPPMRSNHIRRVRLLFWLDSGLLLTVAVLQTPRATGITAHEWLGLGIGAVAMAHLLVNWGWIVAALRGVGGRRAGRTRVSVFINSTLFVLFVLSVFSGLVISEVVLPLAGLRQSLLAAWRQLHSVVATLTIFVVGLHLALNWDWIAGVLRSRSLIRSVNHEAELPELGIVEANRQIAADEEGRTTGLGRALRVLGLRDLPTAGRSLAALVLAFAALSAVCFVVIEAMAHKTIPGAHERMWATPSLLSLPQEVGMQILLMAIVAVVGKKIFRLRL